MKKTNHLLQKYGYPQLSNSRSEWQIQLKSQCRWQMMHLPFRFSLVKELLYD